MPPKVNQQVAEDTVFDNLGLDPADLGVDDLSTQIGDDNEDDNEVDTDADDDNGVGNDDNRAPTGEDDDSSDDGVDDLTVKPQKRVSHTEKGKQQQQQQQKPQRPFPKNAEVRPDKKGNLVDKDGKIVAKAGVEARFYTQAHKAKQAAQVAQLQVQDYQGRLERAVEIGTQLHDELDRMKAEQKVIKDLGLAPNELLEAAQLAAQAKQNPLAVVRNILTRAAANGIDISQLGLPANGTDLKGFMELVRSEIGTALNPLKQRTAKEQEQEQQREAQQEAQRSLTTHVVSFFKDNPEALQYQQVFAEVLKQPFAKNMSLGEVWARIQLHLERARLNGGNRQNNRNGSPRRRGPSMPNGRSNFGNGRTQNNRNQDDVIASPATSYETILRDVMKAHRPNRR
jgi:hypothetical protein